MKKSIISVIVTVAVIAMIIISGGAEAFELNLRLSDSNVRQGQTIILTPTIQVTSEDSNLPVNYLVLIIENLNGNLKKTCKFDVNGNILSSCDGVLNIRLVERTSQSYGYGYGTYLGALRDYGYGYGYTQGNMTYEITLSTENLIDGTYAATVQVKIKDDIFEKFGGNFVVSPRTVIDTDSGSGSDDHYSITDNRISYESDEEMLDIREYQSYNFKYGDEDHKINVNTINLNSVDMVVHSTPKPVKLSEDDLSRIDLDDEVYGGNDMESTSYTTDDLEMKILYVGEEGKEATISLKGLNNSLNIERVPYVETTEIAPVTENLDITQNSVVENEKTYGFNELVKSPLNWLILFIVLNLIMIILIIIRKKR